MRAYFLGGEIRNWCCTNLSGGGQQVDSGQKHPPTTRLLTLVHLQELDYGSAGRLWKKKQNKKKHTHKQTDYQMESDSWLLAHRWAAGTIISDATDKSSQWMWRESCPQCSRLHREWRWKKNILDSLKGKMCDDNAMGGKKLAEKCPAGNRNHETSSVLAALIHWRCFFPQLW